jgi:hypothetical protein
MTVSQVLRDSGKLVEKGWVRGSFFQSGRYCALGALRQTVFGTPLRCGSNAEFQAATELLAKVMKEQFETKMSNGNYGQMIIVDVNDEHAKNRREIVACFEKAANLAECE